MIEQASLKETIATGSGMALEVLKKVENENVAIEFRLPGKKKCLLHWGLKQPGQQTWQLPPEATWPPETRMVGAALQTPFAQSNGREAVQIRLPRQPQAASLDFVLFFPDQNAWDNNHGRNYRIEFPPGELTAGELDRALQKYRKNNEPLFQRTFELGAEGRLAALVTKKDDRFVLLLLTDIPGLLLHWGVARYSSSEWFVPAEALRPPGTVLYESHTAQTPFVRRNGVSELRIESPAADAPMGLQFVLKKADSNQWLRCRGDNFFVPVRVDYNQHAGVGSPELTAIAQEIIQAEMARNSWTLMHRFNLCHDLLDRINGSVDGLALLFVWLRYSALRQLTWQRNYNTKPRELSHAEDRLTQKLAQLYNQQPESRPLVRLMLSTVGPGGEGQRIRDEILQIMHRHHIKEVAGHFLEEWHQKLHNNTTPDDIVICDAYLEFLYSNGNIERFYQKLQEGGVTRQRLESFERPIRSQPDFVPHLKDALVHDFQNFLRILRSVHGGTDLESAIQNARSTIDGDTQALLWRIWDHRQGQIPMPAVASEITEARNRLHGRIGTGSASRELLYLDLALEQFLRLAIERNAQQATEGNDLVELVAGALQNRLLSAVDPELDAAQKHWQRLKGLPRFDADWSLHAKSVLDRIARVLSANIDSTYRLLQPKAEMLGHAFQADAWVITLFSEEVVRGNSLDFVLSMLLRNTEPMLRKAARLGNWQIVSRGAGAGMVEVLSRLRDVQGKTYDSPRVVVADHVSGDEEIPEGVTAVIAPDVTDIVSHVAVRARNAGLLFASCYDRETFEHLKSLRGRSVRVQVNPSGDVLVEETKNFVTDSATRPQPRARRAVSRPKFSRWVLSANEFDSKLTGGKSVNLTRLKLPAGVQRPASIAIPFGICEHLLEHEINRALAAKYRKLLSRVSAKPQEVLPELRSTIEELAAPSEFEEVIRQKAIEAHLPWQDNWEPSWRCVKRVWASKWNDRAFFSRRTQNLPDEDLLMAVLIQEVVPADYAYVAHTVNPFSGDPNELYVEIVVGLGETLVGNYPGRALGAICDKRSGAARLVGYPSKSHALHGGRLIFRSDSNGEDLAGFAGAGLYESFFLPEPKTSLVDYSSEPLVWDSAIRSDLLRRIAEACAEIERAAGAPQDIEGAVRQGKLYVVQTRPQVGVSSKSDKS